MKNEWFINGPHELPRAKIQLFAVSCAVGYDCVISMFNFNIVLASLSFDYALLLVLLFVCL